MTASGVRAERASGLGARLALATLLAAGCTATDADAGRSEVTRNVAAQGFSQALLDASLRDAAWAGDVDTARRLIAQGADVNAEDETQQSAFLIATSEGHLELLEVALDQGGDVTALDSWNGTGLIRAAERGHFSVVGRLLTAGVAKDHVNRIGYQAIHEAVWLGKDTEDYATTLRVLLAGGVSIDTPSGTEGLTPLRMASERGHAGLARILRDAADHRRSADPDLDLLTAARSGDATAFALALRDGGRLEAIDPDGRSIRSLAEAGGHRHVLDVIHALRPPT